MKNNTNLEYAYLATSYQIPELALAFRIGESGGAFHEWFMRTGHATWAFLGACNPKGILMEAVVNTQRHAALCQLLQAKGQTYLEGLGIPDEGHWPPEAGVLILDITLHDALQLAAELDQLAMVYGTLNKPPQLYWTSSSGASGSLRPG